ncbi:hypothetical protein [Flavobacterium sp. 140616W15]|uniref:hypothetical protein n=1 Tax=Flavobacterium sp. 140616W15 TaxID=2478552 RepID=UPI000F0C8C5F|nr:hypothetical protein [Flavobacterium sp. 140616W15]AYN05787.1 hypothetical protein EAG11_17735 [Flavobacterium sp. 140616W15]
MGFLAEFWHKNETIPQDSINSPVNTLNTKAEKAQKSVADGYANNILGRTFTYVIIQNLKLVTTSPYYDIANTKHQ